MSRNPVNFNTKKPYARRKGAVFWVGFNSFVLASQQVNRTRVDDVNHTSKGLKVMSEACYDIVDELLLILVWIKQSSGQTVCIDW